MKSKFAVIALMLIASTAMAGEELVQVIESRPIYSANDVYNSCNTGIGGRVVCEPTARPDRPFPLPKQFTVTVRRQDGSIETFRDANSYRSGSRITVITD